MVGFWFLWGGDSSDSSDSGGSGDSGDSCDSDDSHDSHDSGVGDVSYGGSVMSRQAMERLLCWTNLVE